MLLVQIVFRNFIYKKDEEEEEELPWKTSTRRGTLTSFHLSFLSQRCVSRQAMFVV